MPPSAAEAAQYPILSLFDGAEVDDFQCKEKDLVEFLCEDAGRLHRERGARVYVITEDRRVVAYIALSADVLVLKTREKTKMGFVSGDPKYMPAVKVGRLAVDKRFERLGLGTRLMRLAFDTASSASEAIGCRLLTVDAKPKAHSYYTKLGFEENKAVPRRLDLAGVLDPESTISMRLDLRSHALPGWARFETP